jgi:YidC/Oxa1 family membrane protein insertase
VDPFSFAPIAAILNAAYFAVEGLVALLHPVAGSLSAALAIVALTALVRLALIPLGVAQVKAEWARRRLAPKLQALQQKYKNNPRLLQEKTLAMYRSENVSPFAGMLPTLAQVPVVSLLYSLFIRVTINGHANALLAQHLFGVPLGTSFLELVATGSWPALAVFAALFVVMGTVAWLARRASLKLAIAPMSRAIAALSWAPFLTLIFAAIVPLAAALYLATTTTWTLVERAILRKVAS